MKNIKMKIENFKGITTKEYEFKKFNLINGKNGSSKSSSLHAFKLLLFNQTDYKLEDMINWNTDKDFFNLVLEFDDFGKHFKIDYTYDKKAKTTRELWISGEKKPYKNTDAVNKLKELYDPDLEIASNIISQKESSIVKVRPADRRNYLQKIHNIEFNTQIEQVKHEIDDIDNKVLKELDLSIEVLSNKTYDIQKEKELPFDNTQYESYKLEKDELTKEINLVEMVQDDKVSKENQLNQLNNKKSTLTLSQSNLRNTIELNKLGLSKLEIELSNIDVEVYSEMDKLTNQSASIQEELDTLKPVRLAVFNEAKLNETYTELLDTRNGIKNKQSEIDLCKSGKCPTCKHEFSSDELSTKESELSSLQTILERLTASYNEETESKKTYDIKKEEVNQKNLKRQSLQSQLDLIQNKIENVKTSRESKLNLTNNKIEVANKTIKDSETRLLELDVELNEIEIQIIEITNYLRKLNVVDISDKKVKLSSVINMIKLYDDTLTLNEHIKETNVRLLEQQIKDKEQLTELTNKKVEVQESKLVLKEVLVILQKKLPNFIITKLMENVQAGMNLFIDNVYDKSLNVKIKEKKDSIYITYGVEDKDIYLASGFEEQLLSLAWKKSLSKLTKSNILFLDEVDDSADTENSLKLFNMIFETNDYDSVICISHNESVKDLFFHQNANIIEM